MRKLFNIIALSTLVAFAACTDLNVSPTSTITAANIFDDEASYEAFLARLYAGFAVTGQQGPSGDADLQNIDEGFSNYLRVYWKAQEFSTDEALTAWGDEGIRDFHAQNWTPSNQFIEAFYNRVFLQISLINEFLRVTQDVGGVSESLQAQIPQFRAEARFLRALSYWHGIDLFGSIPFVTDEDEPGASAPRQGTRQEIFDFIESELLAIEGDLAPAGTVEYGRADQGALWTLLGKLYLNAEIYTGTNRYTDCVTFCNRVINANAYSLNPVYQNNFTADNELSPEVIFPIPFDGQRTQTFGGTTLIIHGAIGGSINAEDFGVNGGWFGHRAPPELPDKFPGTDGPDQRAIFFTDGQSKTINDITNFNDGLAVVKFTNIKSDGAPGSDLVFVDTDFPLFRLADVYLMLAEAVLRGGTGSDAGTALNLINDLRQRAYGDASGNITAPELTLDFILDERARELYWEGHRRTDLIRYNQFTENGIWAWKGGVLEGRTTEGFRDIYPIPSSELVANPTLVQNPGY